jgi:hypothetical protein
VIAAIVAFLINARVASFVGGVIWSRLDAETKFWVIFAQLILSVLN